MLGQQTYAGLDNHLNLILLNLPRVPFKEFLHAPLDNRCVDLYIGKLV